MAAIAAPMSAPPAYVSQIPAYYYADTQSSPMYSDTPTASERVLQPTSYSAAHTLNRSTTHPAVQSEFIYKTDHMEVNMGSRIWGLRTPAYGRHGHIEGSVKFLSEQAHVSCVGVRLLGEIVIKTSNFGQICGQESERFLRKSITLYSPSRWTESMTRWDGEHRFSFELPSSVDIRGKCIPLPATFTACLPSTYCEITYVLKFDMVRKGFRRHEKLRVPISYLPKSRPSQPPVIHIPWPTGNSPEDLFFGHDRISTTALSEHFLFTKAAANLNSSRTQSIKMALPSPSCFTAGERIPFVLSLSFPDEPAVPSILVRDVRIELIKRTRLSRLGGLEVAMREVSVGRADIQNIKESGDGVTHLSGVILAGKDGREYSWKIYTLADVQYIVRTVISPPKFMQGNLAGWRSDIEVQMTTDLWGTLERELLATDGTPTPALALAPNQMSLGVMLQARSSL